MHCSFTLAIVLLIVSASAFKPVRSNVGGAKLVATASKTESVAALSTAVSTLSTLILTQPTPAMADGASAVTVPLVISGLVMVPFLYYQQALRPQKKTIEITTTSKAKPVKKSGGLFGKKKAPEPEAAPVPEPKKGWLSKLQNSQKTGF